MSLVTLLVLFIQFLSLQSAASPLERMRAKTAIEQVTNLPPAGLAGQYKNPSKELISRVGPPLSGNSLYIFPDASFVYCEWAT